MSLTTPRIEIRPFVIGDAAAVHAYGANPEVIKFMDWGPNTWDETLDFLSTATTSGRPERDLAIIERETGELIGGVGARQVGPGRWEIGWVLRQDKWGLGYATEAAGALIRDVAAMDGVQSIEARCRPENRKSARVMEKLGMHYVKRIVGDRTVRGELVDSLLYSVTVDKVLEDAAAEAAARLAAR